MYSFPFPAIFPLYFPFYQKVAAIFVNRLISILTFSIVKVVILHKWCWFRTLQVLAFEAGRKHGIRVNTISAGPLGSRAAKAIGFIDDMINYSCSNAPLQQELKSDNVGNTAAFLASPLASAITGTVIYVDNGLHAMGLAVDSPCVAKAASAPSEMSNVPAWSGPLFSSNVCSLLLTVKSDHFFWPCLQLKLERKGSPSFLLVP